MKQFKIFLLASMVILFTACGGESSSTNKNVGDVGERSAKTVTKELKITGLYVAYFNRAADQEGLKYWTDKADEVAKAGGDTSSVFKKLSAGFATHPTFKSTYDHLNNKEFVSLIYRNALGRDGDAEGIAYWTKKIDNEGMIRSDMVSDFVELSLVTDLTSENYPNLSAEELAAGQLRQDLITNKATAALAFTSQLGVLSNVVDSQDPEEDPAYLASIKIISEVTEEPETVSGTLVFLDSIKESDDPIRDILEADSIVNPPALAQCAGDPPAEGSVAGLYRSYSYPTPYAVISVAISLRGWRTVAGTDGSGLYLFSRSQADPIVHTLVSSTINDVDMSRDGSVVAASDGDGKIYLFECDASQPSWSYATEPDDNDLFPEVEVAVSDDGRWLAAASDYHFYLFRRDNAVPVLKLKLSDTERLSTLAISGDGSRLALATEFAFAVNGKRAATLFLFNRDGLLWQTQILSEECSANVSFLPLALSRDGTKLAAGGCDNQIRFWDTASASPTWTAQIGNGEEITGVAMAADGNSLAINGETIHYVRDTAAQPDFSSADNWAFNYWLTYKQPSVYGALDSFGGLEWDGFSGKAPRSGPGNVSISDNGHYIFAGSTAVSYLLHRDDNEVTRLFGTLEDKGQDFYASAISPQASWVTTGSIFGNEILRFEVAPVQKISADLPLTVTYPSDSTVISDFFGLFGVDSYTISYTVLKPGRAADINQHWSLWGFDGTVFVSPATDLFCSGDAEWNWTLNLADGDIESTGSREIEPPHCLASSISSVGTFDLFADTEPINPEQGGVSNLHTDSTLLMNIQVGSGP